METGPQLKVSSDTLAKPGIEPATPGLQGKRFIHYITNSQRLHSVDVAYYDMFHAKVGKGGIMGDKLLTEGNLCTLQYGTLFEQNNHLI